MEKHEKKAKILIEKFENYVIGVLNQNGEKHIYTKDCIIEIMYNATKFLDLESWRFENEYIKRFDNGKYIYNSCKRCGYQPVSLLDSVRHDVDGCSK